MADGIALKTLIAVNREFFGSRWTEKDLTELVDPRFGVVSDLSSLVGRLAEIRAKDLGDVAPPWAEGTQS
ncbi:hypothetical protein AB3X96_40015 [Paraburkholderia sp. BR13439]|uniref:Uncharacterized protein n=1 Tax=Paraburkholderia youngii TaxID=2782701 RepID=A0A7Y6K773_9BURK|nr:hypothetical protein [Paraburkholderia youngii]NUY05547.1 hypothetical protein [Paraburkholderia youngii]